MKDNELRGLVLKRFYDLRHQHHLCQLPDIVASAPTEHVQIANICDQLNQHGLIDWRPMRTITGIVGGMGKITANGVDVIEGTTRAPIALTLNDHRISVSESSNVQIGTSNTQGVNTHIKKLIAAVDHSRASDSEKEEANSLLEKLFGNSLIQSVWGTIFGSGT